MSLSLLKIKSRWFEIVLFLLLAFFAFMVFYNLNATPLENWDESFYAEVTKQMMRTHQFIVPYFNGAPFLQKPPLQNWITASLASVFGLSEFIIRFPSAAAALVIMILVLWFSYKRWGGVPTIFVFATLAFNNIFMWRSRTGNLDALTTLFFVLIFLLILNKNKYRYPLLGLAFGLLYMTKLGVVVFPVLIFIFDEITTLKLKIFKNIFWYLLMGLCALVIPATWLFLGYRILGHSFTDAFIFNASQGVSSGAGWRNFNTDYIMYAYYSLQRRFFWFLVFGFLCLLLKIKNRLNRLLLLFSILLWIPLLFTPLKNNWYLMPLMPFWSLSIAYGVWQLLKWVPGIVRFLPKVFKVKQIYFLGSILLLAFCAIIGYKTYTVNITPLYKNYTTLKEAETAKALKNLTGKNDTIIRLGYSYPVTIYYSDRKVVIGQEMSDEYLASQIRDNGLTWVAGNKGDADKLLPLVKNKNALVIPTNDQEEIIKFY